MKQTPSPIFPFCKAFAVLAGIYICFAIVRIFLTYLQLVHFRGESFLLLTLGLHLSHFFVASVIGLLAALQILGNRSQLKSLFLLIAGFFVLIFFVARNQIVFGLTLQDITHDERLTQQEKDLSLKTFKELRQEELGALLPLSGLYFSSALIAFFIDKILLSKNER